MNNNLRTLREPLFAKPGTLKAYLYMAYCTKDKEILENARRNAFLMIEGAISPLEANTPICELRDRVRSLRARLPQSSTYLTVEKGEVVGVTKPDIRFKEYAFHQSCLDSIFILLTNIETLFESFKFAATLQDTKNIATRKKNLLEIINLIKKITSNTNQKYNYRDHEFLTKPIISKSIYANIGKRDEFIISASFYGTTTIYVDTQNRKSLEILKIFESSQDSIHDPCLNITMLRKLETVQVVVIAAQIAFEIMLREPNTTIIFLFTNPFTEVLKRMGVIPNNHKNNNEIIYTKNAKIEATQEKLIKSWQKKVSEDPILFGHGPLLPTY